MSENKKVSRSKRGKYDMIRMEWPNIKPGKKSEVISEFNTTYKILIRENLTKDGKIDSKVENKYLHDRDVRAYYRMKAYIAVMKNHIHIYETSQYGFSNIYFENIEQVRYLVKYTGTPLPNPKIRNDKIYKLNEKLKKTKIKWLTQDGTISEEILLLELEAIIFSWWSSRKEYFTFPYDNDDTDILKFRVMKDINIYRKYIFNDFLLSDIDSFVQYEATHGRLTVKPGRLPCAASSNKKYEKQCIIEKKIKKFDEFMEMSVKTSQRGEYTHFDIIYNCYRNWLELTNNSEHLFEKVIFGKRMNKELYYKKRTNNGIFYDLTLYENIVERYGVRE